MLKLPSNLLLLFCLMLYACVPLKQVAPQASKSEYSSLIGKAVAYLRESDKLFQLKGVVDFYKLSQAEAIFSLAKDLRPDDPEALDGIGSVHLRRGDIQTARVLFLECVKLDPEYARAYVHLAYLEEIAGRHAISAKLLRTAISLNPRDYHALNNLGGMLYDFPSLPTDKTIGKKMLIQAIEIGEKDSMVLEHNKKILAR